MKNVWSTKDNQETIARIQKLNAESKPLWGKMSVGQMLAHANVSYELVYENKHPSPNFMAKIFLKLIIKNIVVNEKPYKHNSPTGKVFVINETKDFEFEKKRLIDFILKTEQVGEVYFKGKESNSFGPLTTQEWSNMFAKHLDHHLAQFGV